MRRLHRSIVLRGGSHRRPESDVSRGRDALEMRITASTIEADRLKRSKEGKMPLDLND